MIILKEVLTDDAAVFYRNTGRYEAQREEIHHIDTEAQRFILFSLCLSVSVV
jgi:hypothetical protein